jgi:hypothetical protein
MNGKKNIAIGFLTKGLFMAYAFLLKYIKDFATSKEEWANSCSIGKHVEMRIAQVSGNPFNFLTHLMGYLVSPVTHRLRNVNTISWLALIGLLMPIGLVTAVDFGLPPALVLIGAMAMTRSVVWLGFALLRMNNIHQQIKDQYEN